MIGNPRIKQPQKIALPRVVLSALSGGEKKSAAFCAGFCAGAKAKIRLSFMIL